MLESVKISRRQSEIRQTLADLSGKSEPTEDELRSMETLDGEYRQNEVRFRAALISEDDERRDAQAELETRADTEWSELLGRFELRQVALALDEGGQLDGPTAEIVTEMRAAGGYRGIPVPWAAFALETRATTSSGTPDPIRTAPTIDRLFPTSAAARMSVRSINVGVGEMEHPVTTGGATTSWAATEGGDLAAPTAYTTVDRPLAPDHTFGTRIAITRKALKQSGAALEQAVRRDMNAAMAQEVDRVIFRGSGSSGEPTGVLALATPLSIPSTDVSAEADYTIYRDAVRRLMDANAAMGPGSARILMKPLTWTILDDALISGTSETEWDRVQRRFGADSLVISTNALPDAAAEDGTGKGAHTNVLTTTVGGVSPIFLGTWGGVDLIRDPYTDAASGGLRLTALATMDVTISRPEQIEILTNVQDRP